LRAYVGIEPSELVFIAETCGGGFGSKGGAYPIMPIPAHMSKKINRPVMLRISRARGVLRSAPRARLSGADPDGLSSRWARHGRRSLHRSGERPELGLQRLDVGRRGRRRSSTAARDALPGHPVLTNTPPRGPQRGPGQNQIAAAVEPLIDKAARQLESRSGRDPPDQRAEQRDHVRPEQSSVTSAYLGEALDQGAAAFNWNARKARSGQRNGSKVTGLGVGTAYHSAGGRGFDGLVVITPDGKLHIHTGVGNLGTYSHTARARRGGGAEVQLGRLVVERGDSSKHLPWNFGQFGSNTSFTMSRTNYVAAMDASRSSRRSRRWRSAVPPTTTTSATRRCF
jgi:xanthine dehydrogenase molybdenum-binding subunit